MPCQVSWQFVAIKSQRVAHGLGAEAAVAGDDLIGTTSAAHAPSSHEAPAAARIIAAKMPSFVMRAPCLNMDDCDLARVGRQVQSAPNAAMAGKFRSKWRPRHS